MNNKGQLSSKLMIVLVLFVMVIAVFSLFFIWGLLAPLVQGQGTQLVDGLKQAIATNSPQDTGLINATNTSSELATNVLGVFELFTYIGFISFFIAFMIICFYVRTYPFLAFFWIFIIIALTFFGIVLSNAYEQATRTTADLTAFYTSWGTNDFLMLNLPIIILVFGVIGGIVLFVLISKDPEVENTI